MFWKDTIERVARTVFQAVVAAVAAVIVGSGGWDAIDWEIVWKTGAFAGIVALLMALASKPIGDSDSAGVLGSDS